MRDGGENAFLTLKNNGIRCLPLETPVNRFKMILSSGGTSLGSYRIGGLAALKSTTFLIGLRDLVLFRDVSISLLLTLPSLSPWWLLTLVSRVEVADSGRAEEERSSPAVDATNSSSRGGGSDGVRELKSEFECGCADNPRDGCFLEGCVDLGFGRCRLECSTGSSTIGILCGEQSTRALSW